MENKKGTIEPTLIPLHCQWTSVDNFKDNEVLDRAEAYARELGAHSIERKGLSLSFIVPTAHLSQKEAEQTRAMICSDVTSFIPEKGRKCNCND